MQPENNKDNKVGDSNSKDLPLLEEADELARSGTGLDTLHYT